MGTARIIVNADDFGKDAATNRRIIDCFDRGLISSATVMANMPGFEEAATWYTSQTKKLGLGVHLNLDEGRAVSDEFRTTYSTAELFYPGKVWRCKRQYLGVLKSELRAQIDKVLSFNINPDHLDSHHHLHTHWPVAQIVVSLAKDYGIDNIRMAGNVLYPAAWPKRCYRFLLNRFVLQRHLKGSVRLFSNLDRFMASRPEIDNETIELMVHPGVDEDYAMLRSAAYARFLDNYELVSYADA